MKRNLWIILVLAILIAALGCGAALAADQGTTYLWPAPALLEESKI